MKTSEEGPIVRHESIQGEEALTNRRIKGKLLFYFTVCRTIGEELRRLKQGQPTQVHQWERQVYLPRGDHRLPAGVQPREEGRELPQGLGLQPRGVPHFCREPEYVPRALLQVHVGFGADQPNWGRSAAPDVANARWARTESGTGIDVEHREGDQCEEQVKVNNKR